MIQNLSGVVSVAKRLPRRLTLGTQLLLGLTLIAIIVAIVAGALIRNTERDFLNTYTTEEKKKAIDLLLSSLLDNIISEDVPRLETTMFELIKHDPGLVLTTITNESGKTLFTWKQDPVARSGAVGPFLQLERRVLTDISKIEFGKAELDLNEIDISELVASTLDLLDEKIQQSGLTIIRDVLEDLPRLQADERRIQQVLLNLVSNAIKYTPTGGTIRLSVQWEPASGFQFAVADNGIGIDPDKIGGSVRTIRADRMRLLGHQGWQWSWIAAGEGLDSTAWRHLGAQERRGRGDRGDRHAAGRSERHGAGDRRGPRTHGIPHRIAQIGARSPYFVQPRQARRQFCGTIIDKISANRSKGHIPSPHSGIGTVVSTPWATNFS